MTFAVACIANLSKAEVDYDLERHVMKNLKWIRPPTWDTMPEDMESFFAEDPRHTPEFATKADMYERHEEEPHHEESGAGHYYDTEKDHRYIYPERFDSHYDDRYEHEYRPNHRSNDDNDEKYSQPRKSKRQQRYQPNPYPGMPMPAQQYQRAPRPTYRETEHDREAREHFEFGARWGAQAHAPYYAPESHRRDPWDMHYDPYS